MTNSTRSPSVFVLVLGALLAVSLGGCTLLPVSTGAPPEGYASRELPKSDPFPNWPVPPGRMEYLILERPHKLEAEKGAGAGTTGAKKLSLAFPEDDVTLNLKWKEMNRGWRPFWGRLDGVNNSPRKEIAAWKLQAILFDDPEDYVVPDSVAYCASIDGYYDSKAKPTIEGSECVMGVVSLWLQDTHLDLPLIEHQRFVSDYAYAYYLANLNLFTYLAEHHDGRAGNFLASTDPARRQVFAIDNGVALGSGFKGVWYNWFVSNWSHLHVPALRKESIDRLRGLKRKDLDVLGVVAQLELDEDGIYRNVDLGKNLDPGDGVRFQNGTIQMGLTDGEIDDVWERIQSLIEDVDEGDFAVF